ncbi:MAG: HAD hydrolase family protein [bacterium]|nr:HAD hydrolase family protein [bacterium]
MPSHLPAEARRRLEPIQLLVLDVDGVLTDGRLYFTPRGDEIKSFSVRDGLGIKMLQKAGVKVAIITGRTSMALALRCRDLGIDSEFIVQGSREKGRDLDRLQDMLGVDDSVTAAMGDDLPDLPVLARVAFAACPADAVPEVAAACDFVCGAWADKGAVREVAELILKAQGKWTGLVETWMGAASGRRRSD